MSVESNLASALVLLYYSCDWLAKLTPLCQPIGKKTKNNVTLSHAFSRAWRRLRVIALNSDWFIALLAPVVIGQSNNFGFGFTKLN